LTNYAQIWTEEARNRMYRAVISAGFTKQKFRSVRKVVLVSEPEAAALYNIKALTQSDIDAVEVRQFPTLSSWC
jgi:hypothetical protein